MKGKGNERRQMEGKKEAGLSFNEMCHVTKVCRVRLSLPVCSCEMQTVGREEIISFSAGGGPVLSSCPSN